MDHSSLHRYALYVYENRWAILALVLLQVAAVLVMGDGILLLLPVPEASLVRLRRFVRKRARKRARQSGGVSRRGEVPP